MKQQNDLPEALAALPPVVLVCGHYGAGKTNFSLNLAVDEARAGRAVTLIDLDIVNPYFRSSDYPDVLEDAGVKMIAPQFARTALDTPSLSGTVDVAIEEARAHAGSMVIIDAGGDDAGATAVGRFSRTIAAGEYAMLYLVNAFREQTTQAREAADLLPEIEAQSRLKATAIVNNSHLQHATTPATIETGRTFAQQVSRMLDLPLICTTIPSESHDLVHSVKNGTLACDSDYFVQVLVKTPWENE